MASTFAELVKGVDPTLVTIARTLRKIILELDVNAVETVETVRLGDNAATYGVGPEKMTDGYAYVMPLREYVNLGFYQGVLLPDLTGLLKGTGKALRHLKIRSVQDAGSPAVLALVSAAVRLRRRM